MSLADSLDILFEDNHCIAVNKPAGWPATHFAGEETVDRLVKAYLKEKYGKPGKVFLGVVHRLDKPVTGVLLFARTSKAAARLAEQFRSGAVSKMYLAVVEGALPGPGGTFRDWLLKNEETGRVEVVPKDTPGAKQGVVFYLAGRAHDFLTLMQLEPQTGRKHQLRVQLSSRGLPIYGDKKYGSKNPFGPAIALHARSLTFLHPIRNEPITLTAELPKYWHGRFAYLLKGAGYDGL